jgi:hypothetical protein
MRRRTHLGLSKDAPLRRAVQRSGPSSLHQSCPDCIIATRGYDFREGHSFLLCALESAEIVIAPYRFLGRGQGGVRCRLGDPDRHRSELIRLHEYYLVAAGTRSRPHGTICPAAACTTRSARGSKSAPFIVPQRLDQFVHQRPLETMPRSARRWRPISASPRQSRAAWSRSACLIMHKQSNCAAHWFSHPDHRKLGGFVDLHAKTKLAP